MLIFFLIFVINPLKADDPCVIKNFLTKKKEEIHCEKNNLAFAFHNFESSVSNLEYTFNKKLDIYLLKSYKNKFLEYIENFCLNDKNLKIKEIINNNKNNKFDVEVIISCKFK